MVIEGVTIIFGLAYEKKHQNYSSLTLFVVLLWDALRGRESKEGMLVPQGYTSRGLSPKVTHPSSSELWFW